MRIAHKDLVEIRKRKKSITGEPIYSFNDHPYGCPSLAFDRNEQIARLEREEKNEMPDLSE